ncbi:epoxide hydrolase N-terminal domain-containing protein [Herbiconiux solani]|uniref:epoxide hydrolase N-terminal domain-containing protein n=1 Tax=Herbiconiux solani TaxID=661329 RepID=UPI001FE10094|nr:epoxide hydrolase N-terminal domain-containing protein [Herbiconiux solani]
MASDEFSKPFDLTTDPVAWDDLRRRLRATRWPDPPAVDASNASAEDAGWALGTDVAYLRELVAYWADGFDWPAREAELGRLPHRTADVGGLAIHFVHAPAASTPDVGTSAAAENAPVPPRPSPCSSPTAGPTRSGATRRSSPCSPTPARTEPTPPTPSR